MGKISKKYQAMLVVGAFIASVTTACTDAMYGSVTRFNKETEIMCYSGSPTPVFVDHSTGKVEYSEHGGGVFYKSKNTGKFVQMYMDCVITED